MKYFNLKWYFHTHTLVAFTISVCVLCVSAQELEQIEIEKSSCSQMLKEVQKDYERGNLERIAGKIEPCVNSQEFTKIEKMQANRLLILTYLFLDDQKNADKWMYNLLKLEPDYKPNVLADPIEYVKLFKSFSINPWISIGTFFGLNRSNARSFHSFSTNNSETSPTKYTAGVGIQLGFLADILLKKKLFLTTEIMITSRSYISNTNVLFDSYITNNETTSWLEMPLSLKYVVGNYKIKPFLRIGGTFMLSSGAAAQLERINLKSNQVELTGAAVDMNSQRSTINFNVFAGGGIMYKLGYGHMLLDGRYILGITNFANPSNRYKQLNELITGYGYLSDDFAITSIQVSLGYSYSFYKIKKNKVKFIVEE